MVVFIMIIDHHFYHDFLPEYSDGSMDFIVTVCVGKVATDSYVVHHVFLKKVFRHDHHDQNHNLENDYYDPTWNIFQ